MKSRVIESSNETFTAPFTVLRLLTPRDTKYHDAVKAYEPYDKIVKPLPEMRREASTALNIYFLHKLGGEVVIDRAEFERIVPDYGMSHSSDEEKIVVRLRCIS